MTGWQPIDDAPRDEAEQVVLWNGTIVQIGSAWESGWVDFWMDWIDPQPTLWQPLALPSPPSEGR